jgi:hypothetical protein
VKILTSCPSCLQGLKRFNDDAEMDADYIVVEIAKNLLGPTGCRTTCGARTPAASREFWFRSMQTATELQ